MVTKVPVTTRGIFSNYDICIYDKNLQLYADYDISDDDFPQTTCNDATVNGMGGEGEVTECLRDDTAMMNYFFACDGRRHD